MIELIVGLDSPGFKRRVDKKWTPGRNPDWRLNCHAVRYAAAKPGFVANSILLPRSAQGRYLYTYDSKDDHNLGHGDDPDKFIKSLVTAKFQVHTRNFCNAMSSGMAFD